MNELLAASFDAVLALSLAALAAGVLWTGDRFRAIVLFIGFGLLLAIAWCRLDAVDVALAEAAIGSGLTGALLLNTLADTGDRLPRLRAAPTIVRWSTWAALAVLAAMLLAVLPPWAPPLPPPPLDLTTPLAAAGADNPVTAVLLNLRAYDTLLEIGVLLLAVMAVAPLALPAVEAGDDDVGPVLQSFVHVMTPVIALVAMYVLWVGSKAPGGAFQAGALVSAVGILWIVARRQRPQAPAGWWRVMLACGLALFLLVGWGTLLAGGRFLEYPRGGAGPLILLIEAAVALSTAATLLVLFLGRIPTAAPAAGTPANRGGQP